MPLRMLLRFLANEQVVERLADTYPIRRVAQLTHYMYRRLTLWGNDALDKAVKSRGTGKPAKKSSSVKKTRFFYKKFCQKHSERDRKQPTETKITRELCLLQNDIQLYGSSQI